MYTVVHVVLYSSSLTLSCALVFELITIGKHEANGCKGGSKVVTGKKGTKTGHRSISQ